MTLEELINKLDSMCNGGTYSSKVRINGTHNWEYISDVRIEDNIITIETTDVEDTEK